MRNTGLLITAAALSLCRASVGAVVTYYGIDPGAAPSDLRPQSDAARKAFDAAAGTMRVMDFESIAPGYHAAQNLGTQLSATFTNADSTLSGISYGLGGFGIGFNTTPGGWSCLRMEALDSPSILSDQLTFQFAHPVDAFGAYFTGVGTSDGALSVQFNDGAARTLNVAGDPNGGALFLGVLDTGASISTVTLMQQNARGSIQDIYAVDDLQYRDSLAVPEPGSVALGLSGLTGVCFGLRRRLKRSTV